MANASAKRIASQNAKTTQNLRLGVIIAGALSLVSRFLLHRSSLSPKGLSFWVYALSFIPSILLSRYLERIGSSRYDPTTGALISAGEDLSRPGVIEWCFDVLYITWASQIGSGALGNWVWWLYLVIPFYAIFKLWGSFISPVLLGRSSQSPQEDGAGTEPVSKRQEKLRKRSEKGDPRVRMQTVR